MQETINGLLAMQTSLRQRQNQLNRLANDVSTTRIYLGDSNRRDEPNYDVVAVDEKLVQIDTALFRIDKAIKQSNAKTEVTIDLNYEDLVSPLKAKA